MKKRVISKLFVFWVVIVLFAVQSNNAYADTFVSPTYRLDESFFGIGGEPDAVSSSYRSRQSAGSLGVGNVSSTNYDAILGNITPDVPFLEMNVTGDPIDLGELSDSVTSYGSPVGGSCGCSFYVRTYLSDQYVVVNASTTPPIASSGYYLTPKSTLGAPSGSSSVEEFGMNLTANTVPGTFGADPVNQPDDSFADGMVASGYSVSNQYKFASGDILAQSPKTFGNEAIGQTNFTVSYIAKKKRTTPAGQYTLNNEIVVVAVY